MIFADALAAQLSATPDESFTPDLLAGRQQLLDEVLSAPDSIRRQEQLTAMECRVRFHLGFARDTVIDWATIDWATVLMDVLQVLMDLLPFIMLFI